VLFKHKLLPILLCPMCVLVNETLYGKVIQRFFLLLPNQQIIISMFLHSSQKYLYYLPALLLIKKADMTVFLLDTHLFGGAGSNCPAFIKFSISGQTALLPVVFLAAWTSRISPTFLALARFKQSSSKCSAMINYNILPLPWDIECTM